MLKRLVKYDMDEAKSLIASANLGSVSKSFTLKVDNDEESLKIAEIATHVADARTCCLHPASTTHRQLTSDELIACGISDDLIRLSVGIEHVDDIIADVKQALEASQE